MPSINDWVAKAAHEIVAIDSHCHCSVIDEEQVIAIIATFAEPLTKALRDSRRSHYHEEDDGWYCCGACTHLCDNDEEDHEHDESCCVDSHSAPKRVQGKCDCGAETWNARVDTVLEGPR